MIHRSRRLRLFAAAIVAVASCQLSAGTARGHAELVSADPSPNASLPDAPQRLTLTFTEAVDIGSVEVDLLHAAGHAVDSVGAPAAGETPAIVHVALPPLEPALYTVRYEVLSSIDGHLSSGQFAFLVDPTGSQPVPSVEPTSTTPVADAPALGARWAGLVGALLALGTLIGWTAGGRPALVAAGVRRTAAPWLLVAVASLGSFGGLAAYLALAARPLIDAGGHAHDGATLPFDLAAPFGWTPFAIAMRIALGGTFVAFAVSIGRAVNLDEARRRGAASARGRTPAEGNRPGSGTTGGERALIIIAGGSLAVALFGMSAAGHVASLGGPIYGLLDWAHLTAVAAWLGALPALLVTQARARELGGGAPRAVLRDAIRRHGRVALVAAPLVALTGVANSPLVLGSAREAVASGYGNLLLAKAVLFSAALGIGAANHLLARSRGLRRLLPLIAGELAVGAVALMAAAAMVTAQPAASRQPVASGSAIGTVHLAGSVGPTDVRVAVSTAAPGQQRYQALLSDAATGAPRDDVQKVFLTFGPPPGTELTTTRVELEALVEPGRYAAAGAYTPVVGDWRLEVTVRRAGALDESAEFALPVTEALAAEALPPPDTGTGVPAPLAALWSTLPPGAPWTPALAAFALLAVSSAASLVAQRRGRPVPALGAARATLAALAVVAGLAAGSQAVVRAASAPPPDFRASPATDPDAPGGERLFLANCASCHGRDGDGDGPAAAGMLPHPGSLAAIVPIRSDGEVAYRIAYGVAGTPMPPFASVLTPSERADLLAYLRNRWDPAP